MVPTNLSLILNTDGPFDAVLFRRTDFPLYTRGKLTSRLRFPSVGIHYRSYRKVVIDRASSVTLLDDASTCQRPVEKNRSSSGTKR